MIRKAKSKSRGTRLEFDDSNTEAWKTIWEFVNTDGAFKISTTDLGSASPNVIDADINFIEIWLSPSSQYRIRAKQMLLDNSYTDWTPYLIFRSKGISNSFEQMKMLNNGSLTIAEW